ncbi:hypothetical protein TNCV_2871061 [Trichonephila clavipes]|nr:hypothetical protein TNCV_2871061 [Trichonephila clavipes]
MFKKYTALKLPAHTRDYKVAPQCIVVVAKNLLDTINVELGFLRLLAVTEKEMPVQVVCFHSRDELKLNVLSQMNTIPNEAV